MEKSNRYVSKVKLIHAGCGNMECSVRSGKLAPHWDSKPFAVLTQRGSSSRVGVPWVIRSAHSVGHSRSLDGAACRQGRCVLNVWRERSWWQWRGSGGGVCAGATVGAAVGRANVRRLARMCFIKAQTQKLRDGPLVVASHASSCGLFNFGVLRE